MTSTLSLAGLLVLFGTALLLFATVQAMRCRTNPRCLILWGALHDVGILLMALTTQTQLGSTGAWLFVIYQVAARLLAWFGLRAMDPFLVKPNLQDLRGVGRIKPYAGAMYALGMLACVGGSPFLVPEGRVFIVNALVETGGSCGLLCLMLMALATTVFIWLHVDAVRLVWLEKAKEESYDNLKGSSIFAIVLGVVVALLGLFRTPLTELIAPLGFVVDHATDPTYTIFYLGAFITGLAFWLRVHYAAYLGCATSFLAFISVLIGSADPLSQLFLVMVTVVALVVSIYSIGYIHERKGWYWFFLLLTFASLAGIVTASESTSMYGYWELMTFASYFLVVHEGDSTAFSAGLKYYIMCAGGALFMIPGLHLLALCSGDAGMLANASFYFKFGAFLCMVGFGVKAGLVPFHSWLPDAHPAAPSSVSGPLSGIITKMGIFGLISFILVGSKAIQVDGLMGMSWFGTGLCAMGAATLIYGEIMALLQQDIKRMLAYSTLGQLGEISLVLGLGTWLATTGALWHMLNHAIMKDLLFLGAGALILRAGSRKLADLRGIGQCMPWTASCMAVGLVSIMGLPPFGAFYSKLLMIQAAIDCNHLELAVLIFVGSLVGAIYYTRILKTIIFEKRPADMPSVAEAPFSMRIGMAVLAFLSLLMALVPQVPMHLVSPVASLCFGALAEDSAILAAISVPWPIYVIVPVFGALLPAFFASDRKKAGWASIFVLLLT